MYICEARLVRLYVITMQHCEITHGRTVNQLGDRPVYIERNNGSVYVGDYVDTDQDSALKNVSSELRAYSPTIKPQVERLEVGDILRWIYADTDINNPERVALLYGGAGIGKSVVMHNILRHLEEDAGCVVLGLKADQVEFLDANDLARKKCLAKPIVSIIREQAQSVGRVVLLVDQIDALSLSLSSNRTPLRSILNLIEQVRSIPHVRVVISCRPYDIEYDPLLGGLDISQKWELGKLTKEQVSEVLTQHGRHERLDDRLLDFLGNPLCLFLYLKVVDHAELTDPVTEELLYGELWKYDILNVADSHVERPRLLECLDAIVNAMYNRQELSVHISEYETSYLGEINYLLSKEVLLLTESGQLQFFHQTLFDYVYARRFVENGHDLMSELADRHQGLFSRAAVKSILAFQRETNPGLYKANLKTLLFARNDDGADKFRYHLKSLALINMTFYESPKKEELDLLTRAIFDSEQYFGVVLGAVHSPVWFKAIWQIIERKGGWPSMSASYKEKIIAMCRRTLLSDADVVLEVVGRILDYGEKTEMSRVASLLLSYRRITCRPDKLIAIYEKLVKSHCCDCAGLLISIGKDVPEYACEEIKANIRLRLSNKENLRERKISDIERDLFRMLEKTHLEYAVRLYADLIMMIHESRMILVPGDEISYTPELLFFDRKRGDDFGRNIVECIINKLIDGLLKDRETAYVREYLLEFGNSKQGLLVFVALCVCSEKPDVFFNETYSILTSHSVLSNAPCWVEYQALEALKAAFPYMPEVQQREIVRMAGKLSDKHDRLSCGMDENLRLRLGIPLTDVDVHRGKVLHALPKDKLRLYDKHAYHECLRIERKYCFRDDSGKVSYPRLENKKPFSVTYVGWPSIPRTQSSKMTCSEWIKAMTKYVDDAGTDIKRPTLSGQCEVLESLVRDDPDKYSVLLDEAVKNEKIPIKYVEYGMRGLIEAGRLENAEHVFMRIVDLFDGNLYSSYRGFEIRRFLTSMEGFIQKRHITKAMVDVIGEAAMNAEEDEVVYSDEMTVYDIGMNRTRGFAGYLLVKCGYVKEYKDAVFDTLEAMAETASVYSRSAVLLNMSVLNGLDVRRNINLFKKLLHDYDPRLMSMPVTTSNPAVYFAQYNLADIKDYFQHALECPSCYKEQVLLLWLAWSYNDHDKDAAKLLDAMCESSQDARVSLLDFLGGLGEYMDEDAVIYIKYLMKPVFDSPELGKACGDMFCKLDDCSSAIRHELSEAYVSSPLSGHCGRAFIRFLAGYSICDPIQTLKWLNEIIAKSDSISEDMWDMIADVLIQSYNGVKSFNDEDDKPVLENAMDLIDQLMMRQDNNYVIMNFINKLDHE